MELKMEDKSVETTTVCTDNLEILESIEELEQRVEYGEGTIWICNYTVRF